VFAPLADLDAQTRAAAWFASACLCALGLVAALAFVS